MAKKQGEEKFVGWREGVARRWIVELIKFSRLATNERRDLS